MENQKNIAETLADVLPKAAIVHTQQRAEGDAILQIAVPKGYELKQIDTEGLLPNPRRTKAKASFSDAASFIEYVKRHAEDGTVTWCRFDPQTFALTFTAVIDEHAKGLAGWRGHQAVFSPEMSAEWKAWVGKNAQSMPQVNFAEWIQEHEDDITSTAIGLPTSLQMHAMATEFVANEERVLKSTVKLQSGGVRLTYIADPDAGTTETMQMFERFAIGIPVFHAGSAWSITARLKYRLSQGKVSFFYELVRPDRVHEGAAKELIEIIRQGIGAVPLLMGACA
jgi:uncharacterized protein YfdQ (DUF2303 family)